MNLSQLYYFCKLAELQHYTQASQELYITQPTLSGAINTLESELGIRLFQKRGRNVFLTKYGKEFYQYVTAALKQLDKGVETAKEHAGKMGGSIDVGSIHTIQGDYLPRVIKAFKEEKGSETVFNIHQAQTNTIISSILSEKWDVGFCSFVENIDELFFVPVLQQTLMAAVNKEHPLASKKSVTFDELRQYSLISYQADQPIGKSIKKLLTKNKLSASLIYSSEEAICGQLSIDETVAAILLHTPGVSIFPNLSILELPEVPVDFRIVHMVFNRKMYKERAVESFIDFVTAFWSYSPQSLKWRKYD